MDKHSMEEERRRRERRHRERKERESGRTKDGKVRKPRGLDIIDKLDVSGIYGPSSKLIDCRFCDDWLLTDTSSVPSRWPVRCL